MSTFHSRFLLRFYQLYKSAYASLKFIDSVRLQALPPTFMGIEMSLKQTVKLMISFERFQNTNANQQSNPQIRQPQWLLSKLV